MIKERVETLLNTQINKEFYSAYMYLSASTYFCLNGLHGFSHWCKVQAKEEVDHGVSILNFMQELGGNIELMQITPPEIIFKSPLDTFKIFFNHEEHVTDSIKNIILIANESNDISIRLFLEKFINEQHEEELSTYSIYEKIKLFGDNKFVIVQLDKELHAREYIPHNIQLD